MKLARTIITCSIGLGYLCYFPTISIAQVVNHHDDHKSHEEENGHQEHGGHDEANDSHDDHHKEVVQLSSKQISELGIQLATAKSGSISISVSAPGEAVVNEDSLSHISARFPGIVKTVKKKVGDSVKAGDALAIIESNESLSLYTIKSLIDGVVIEKHATIGELLQGDDIAFSIADLSSVWINLSIYQVDLPLIKTGQSVKLSQGHGNAQTEGKISYVSPVVDEKTRTAVARVVIENPDSSWRPGLFVTGDIIVEQKEVNLRLENSAIQTIEDRPHVFVKSEEGFQAREVVTGIANSQHVEILSGLTVGDEYVAENGFVLKAELSKSSFGHGHAH